MAAGVSQRGGYYAISNHRIEKMKQVRRHGNGEIRSEKWRYGRFKVQTQESSLHLQYKSACPCLIVLVAMNDSLLPQSTLRCEVPGLPERMQMHALRQSGYGRGGAAEGPQEAVGEEEVAKEGGHEKVLSRDRVCARV